jgi:FHS family glucose/mannose:H+ symporter-like MFS transporter
MVLGLLSGVAALLALKHSKEYPDLGEGLSTAAVGELVSDYRLLFVVVVAMNLCYVGSEAVPNAWIPKYLHDTFPGHSEFRGTLVLSLFWAAITAGRFACAALLARGAPSRMLLGILAGGACLCLLVAPFLARLASEIAFIASGLFFSGMFPIIISHTERLPDKSFGAMFILVMAAGMLGAALAGASVGMIADFLTFRAGMMTAAGLCLLVLALIPLLSRGSKQS